MKKRVGDRDMAYTLLLQRNEVVAFILQKVLFLHALLDIFVNVPSFCQYPQTRKAIFSFVDFSHSPPPHVQNVQRLHLSIQVCFLFLMP